MMEGCSLKKDCEATSQTVVLVGRTGNGKSATGNTILGRMVFRSERSPSGVTTTSELQTMDLDDGRKLNVIDTPGGDELEADDETLEDYLHDSPETLKKVKEQAERFQVLKETMRFTEKENSVMMEQIRDEQFNRIAEMVS